MRIASVFARKLIRRVNASQRTIRSLIVGKLAMCPDRLIEDLLAASFPHQVLLFLQDSGRSL